MVKRLRSKRRWSLPRGRMLRYEREALGKGLRIIAGVDEAGRGPLAGPIVASAVVLKEVNFSQRIDDSKKLSSSMRQRAYREILDKTVVGIGIANETLIDKFNISFATIMAMEEAVYSLEIKPDYLLVDGLIAPSSICSYRNIIKGDAKSLSIACASIISKVTRDRIMVYYDRVYPEYKFAAHKGYCTRRHLSALMRHGPSPIHRKSFKPVRELIEVA